MTTQNGTGRMVSREVDFCRAYSMEAKEQLEKLFLKNRISYFIEWQDRSLFSRIFGKNEKGKNIFTIRINEADIEKATELVNGIDSVKIRKKKENERYVTGCSMGTRFRWAEHLVKPSRRRRLNLVQKLYWRFLGIESGYRKRKWNKISREFDRCGYRAEKLIIIPV